MDWHTRWLFEDRAAAKVRKNFWRSQKRRNPQTRLAFLIGDSILNGDADDADWRIAHLFNELVAETYASWQVCVVGGDNPDVLRGAYDVLPPQSGDVAILQDSGPRVEDSRGMEALWTARTLFAAQFDAEVVLMTAACGTTCPASMNWNSPLPPDNTTSNDIVRAVAQNQNLQCFDFERIAASAGMDRTFKEDGIHLAPQGAFLLASALLAYLTGEPLSEKRIVTSLDRTKLEATSTEIVGIHRAVKLAADSRLPSSSVGR